MSDGSTNGPDGGRPSADERHPRWHWFLPGQSLIGFPLAAAVTWGFVIGAFATVSLLADTDDGGSWSEVAGAVVGNVAVVFVLTLAISAGIRWSRRQARKAPHAR